MKFKSNIELQAGLEDNNAASGTSGQVLSSTGTGVEWIDQSAISASSNFVYFEVKNETGSTINKGKGVMAVGTDGNSGHILIDEMVADGSVESKYFLGVLETTVANGGFARVISFGQLDQFNTLGQNGETWLDGQVLWCDPDSAGDFTITEPDGPNLKIPAAFIMKAATNGKIQIRVQGHEGIKDLYDTKITSHVDGELLVWNNTLGVWQNDGTATVDYTNGRVGIGTTSPSEKLEVAGNIDTTGNIIVNAYRGFSNSGSWTRNATPYGYIDFGPANTNFAHIYTDRPYFYFNKQLQVLGNTVWNSGNDGSGSGLDADLLDGQQGLAYFRNNYTSGGDLNTDSASGIYRFNTTELNRPGGIAYGTLVTFNNSADTGFQLVADYHNTGLYWRGGNSATFGGSGTNTSWFKIWHDGNDGSGSGLDADLLDGQHGSYYATASHTHDDRYYTESEIQTYFNRGYITAQSATNLAAGWYTIATNTGDRALGEFQIWDVASSRHQSVLFNASHHFGSNNSNDITVLANSRFSNDVFRYIRIKENDTYEGAALQVYIDDATNNVHVAITGANAQENGWVLKDWVADATDPGDLSNYSSFTEACRIDLDNTRDGGIETTGKFFAQNDIIASNSVGIGTASPASGYKLDVNGNITVSGTGSFGSTVDAASPNINNWIFKATNSDFSSESGFYDANNHIEMILRNSSNTITTHIKSSGSSFFNGGNVGIGTTNPLEKLHVSSGSGANGDCVLLIEADADNTVEASNPVLRLRQDGGSITGALSLTANNEMTLYNEQTGKLFLGVGNSAKMTIDINGNVGIGTTNPGAKLDVRGLILSDQIQTKEYTSLTGSSGDWFPIGAITDHSTGPVRYSILTYAHSSIDFIVSEAHSLSNTHNITVLNSNYDANGGFANVSAVRVRQDGGVEIKLVWSSGPSVQVRITVRGTYGTPTLPSSLATTTNTSTVIDTVDNSSGKMRTQKTLEVGSTVLLNYSGSSYLNGGNVGIGITTPTNELEVVGTTTSNTFQSYDSSHIRVVNPGGGTIAFGATTTGAINITLPQSWTNTMMSFTIRIFDYASGKSFDVRVHGYNYYNASNDTGYWANTSAYTISSPSTDRNFTIRFGHDGTNCCVIVGETTSTWSYLKVAVLDFQGSHASYNKTQWNDGWSISAITTLPTISNVITNTQLGNWQRDGQNLYYGSGTGNVGIGTTSPSYKLDVSGTGRFTGDHTANDHINTSDRRKKKNINPYKPQKIDVNWVNFKWKDGDGSQQLGTIAQDLEERHPEFVVTNEEGEKGVRYTQLHSAKIAELEAENKELKNRLDKLEKLVEKLCR